MWYSVIAIPHAKMTPNDVSRENKRVVQLWNSLLYRLSSLCIQAMQQVLHAMRQFTVHVIISGSCIHNRIINRETFIDHWLCSVLLFSVR